MWVAAPLIAVTLSLLTAAVAVISWFAARQARKDRVLTETVPQLQAVVFGPQGQTGRPKREEGLEGRMEALERENVYLKKQVRSNRRRIERTQAVVLDIVSPQTPESGSPLDTGQFRALAARFQDLDEPGDTDPPPSDE